MKDKYPHRESIIPVDIPIEMTLNQPAHRFRAKVGGYPLIQIGAGILTLNTIDDIYEWNSFFKDATETIERLSR